MQLLLEHSQSGKVFRLWAKYELSGQEETLVDGYDIRRVILVEGNPRQERERAMKLAGALAVVVFALLFVFSTPADAVILEIVTFIGGWIGIYSHIRETVKVGDILNGRHFSCRSIVTLEVMRMFKKGQFAPWIDAIGGGTEASFVNRLFGLYA